MDLKTTYIIKNEKMTDLEGYIWPMYVRNTSNADSIFKIQKICIIYNLLI